MAQAGGCGLEYFYLREAVETKTTGPGPVSLSQVGDGGSRRAVLSALPSLNCLVNLLDRNRDGEPGWFPPPSEPGLGGGPVLREEGEDSPGVGEEQCALTRAHDGRGCSHPVRRGMG